MSQSPRKCRAKNLLKCPHHNPYTNKDIVISHGVPVVKNKFQAGDFAKSFNVKNSINGYFDGSWEDLEKLVKKHRKNFEPGTGAVNNDVILVTVPSEGFYTAITTITDNNRATVTERDIVRREGEKPVGMKIVKGVKEPAQFVKVVCYRADVLEQDNGRTTDAEWEIVAINAQPDFDSPMHPATMLRNSNHDEGGTLREYTQQEWDVSYAYWDNHAYIED